MNTESKKVLIYGYSSPTDGTFCVDEKTFFVGEDFRTVERYKEYLDVGMNTLLLQRNDPYSGEEFSNSQLKKNMDNAFLAGIKKIIVTDNRLYDLSSSNESLIGEGKRFKNKKELDNYVEFCMKDYSKHPAFLGVMLRDEPHIDMLSSISELQNSISRVCPHALIQCNFLPSLECARQYFPKGEDLNSSYTKYLEEFFSSIPQECVSVDSYPFLNSGFIDNHYSTLNIFSQTAKHFNKDVLFVVQSVEMLTNQKPHLRKVTESDLLLEFNTSFALGSKGLAYFTYWRKQANATNGEFFVDGSSFITSNGEKTFVYNYVKTMFEKHKGLVNLLTSLSLNTSYFLNDIYHANNEHNKLPDHLFVKSSKPLLVTELNNSTQSLIAIVALNNTDNQVADIVIENINDFNIVSIDGTIENNKILLNIGEAIFLERKHYDE